jgi:molecular chaperone DnaJ
VDASSDFYALLGVKADGTAPELRRAYRKLAVKLHPDRNPGDGDSERRFKAISEAYSVLSNEETRRKYDDQRRQRPPEPDYPVADVSVEIELNPRESQHGCEKTVTVSRPIRCRDCRGTGRISMMQTHTCILCQGSGCASCGFRGWITTDYCARCWNTGRENELATILVTVPPETPIHGRWKLVAHGDLWGIMRGPFYVNAYITLRVQRPGLIVR